MKRLPDSLQLLFCQTLFRNEGRDRGDVPGWVLITMMTAGLVIALWALAGEALSTMFTDAMRSVTKAGNG
ncbi:hypothetical protein LWF01_11985 [Saxibacter everestensis]|uniref:Flp pilus assembly protein, pilin Flp n=1 Tax=Saxibacter everestensis TaxID=2909229 RepID=A0ABY8QPD5_9MICO|nr:hypothetical protein LWF01_11985 [Brevibacteriaceae bacterium ZFBP1038]